MSHASRTATSGVTVRGYTYQLLPSVQFRACAAVVNGGSKSREEPICCPLSGGRATRGATAAPACNEMRRSTHMPGSDLRSIACRSKLPVFGGEPVLPPSSTRCVVGSMTQNPQGTGPGPGSTGYDHGTKAPRMTSR